MKLPRALAFFLFFKRFLLIVFLAVQYKGEGTGVENEGRGGERRGREIRN